MSLCSTLRPLRLEGSLSCPTCSCYDTVPRFARFQSMDRAIWSPLTTSQPQDNPQKIQIVGEGGGASEWTFWKKKSFYIVNLYRHKNQTNISPSSTSWFSWLFLILSNSWFFPEFHVKTPDNSWFSIVYP